LIVFSVAALMEQAATDFSRPTESSGDNGPVGRQAVVNIPFMDAQQFYRRMQEER
jgi:hypothetical protein